MKLLLCLVVPLVAGSSVAADPAYIVTDPPATRDERMDVGAGSEARSEADTYARAAKLPVLADGNRDELRIWVTVATFDPQTNGIATTGYVASSTRSSQCSIHYRGKELAPSGGSCKVRLARSRGSSPLDDIRELAKLSGHGYSCGVMDGAWMIIDGVTEGRRFILAADNPAFCDDEHSKLIATVLGKMR